MDQDILQLAKHQSRHFATVVCISNLECIMDEVDDSTDSLHSLATNYANGAKRTRPTLKRTVATFTGSTNSTVESEQDESFILVAAIKAIANRYDNSLVNLEDYLKNGKLLDDDLEGSTVANAKILRDLDALNQ